MGFVFKLNPITRRVRALHHDVHERVYTQKESYKIASACLSGCCFVSGNMLVSTKKVFPVNLMGSCMTDVSYVQG